MVALIIKVVRMSQSKRLRSIERKLRIFGWVVLLGHFLVLHKTFLLLKRQVFNHELAVDAEVRLGFKDGWVPLKRLHRVRAGQEKWPFRTLCRWCLVAIQQRLMHGGFVGWGLGYLVLII
jgi:hypothetical protein